MKILFVTVEWPFDSQPYRAPFAKFLFQLIHDSGFETEALPCQLKRNLVNVVKYRRMVTQGFNQGNFTHIHAYSLTSLWLIKKSFLHLTSVSAIGSDVLGIMKQNGRYSQMGELSFSLLASKLFHVQKIRAVSLQLAELIDGFLQDNTVVDVFPDPIAIVDFPIVSREAALDKLGWNPNCLHIFFPSNPDRAVKNYALAKRIFEDWQEQFETIELHLPPMESHESMNLYFRACDLVLLTSIHEGSPNVIKEALLCDTPFIATEVGDLANYVNLGYGAFVPKEWDSTKIKLLGKEWITKKREGIILSSEYAKAHFSSLALQPSVKRFFSIEA